MFMQDKITKVSVNNKLFSVEKICNDCSPINNDDLAILLSGSTNKNGTVEDKGTVLFYKDLNKFESMEGTEFIGKISGAPVKEAQFINNPQKKWYDKYQAFVGKIEEVDQAEMSMYVVSLPKRNNDISLHVHHDVTNLIFVTGNGKKAAGAFLAKQGDKVIGLPLYAGDFVKVEPGVLHNLMALDDDFDFVVINTSDSKYEQEESSDYHNIDSVNISEIKYLQRSINAPQFITVG